VLSGKLYLDTSVAARNDDINKTVNYAEICAMITEFTKANTCKLIETAIEQIAEVILINYPIINSVELTLRKPWAPIGLPVDCAGVSINRGRHKAYIALGSNMGDRRAYLDGAVTLLNEDEKCRVVRVSDYIETKPYGEVEQDDFLNGCVEIETLYSPNELLKFINEIEAKFGRERTIHWGPRTLDLDILLYDDIIMQTEKLTIPHIEMCKRDFVLKPLFQIAPYAKHPVSGKTVMELLAEL
jgi:dihydroneopterin aldolase/2-amino-4-hydroxy-6-hydroxymethyldihydropteridine diphosphokinase